MNPRDFAAIGAILTALAVSGCGPEAVEVPGPAVPVLPACATVDDPGPCLWDAQTQGNGKGTSFIRYRNRTFIEEQP